MEIRLLRDIVSHSSLLSVPYGPAEKRDGIPSCIEWIHHKNTYLYSYFEI